MQNFTEQVFCLPRGGTIIQMREKECQPAARSSSQSSNSLSKIWGWNGLCCVVLICLRSLIPWLLNLFSQCCRKISSFCREKLFPKTYLERHYFGCPIEDLALQIPRLCKDRVHPSPLSSPLSFDAINKSSKYSGKEHMAYSITGHQWGITWFYLLLLHTLHWRSQYFHPGIWIPIFIPPTLIVKSI